MDSRLAPANSNGRRNHSAGASPVFDRDAALIRLDGDEELFDALVQIFQQDSVELEQQLLQALAAGDLRSIERAAHSLKGLAANFDAISARDAAFAIEQFARLANREALPAAVGELRAYLNQLRDAFRRAGFE